MARILEHDVKRILADHGINVPEGKRATGPDEAVAIARTFGGGAVVKALVPTGRRGKAGLVVVCATPEEAGTAAERLLGTTFNEYVVDAVLVESLVLIQTECYLSLTIDPRSLEIAVLASAQGGVDIESHADTIRRLAVSPLRDPDIAAITALWESSGIQQHAYGLAQATAAALKAFAELDATLLELNPLAIDTAGNIVAVGAMLSVDDAALPRQPELAQLAVEGSERAARPETDLERRVAEINADRTQRGSARYLELEGGDIGFLCGGGGASLLLFDALVAAGGQPANYSEFGGNPTEQRVYDLTRVVLSKPGVRGLFVAHNITNNTQVDVVARGVTRAVADAGVGDGFPVVAREVGVNDDEGRRIFESAGVRYLGESVSLNAAARIMVESMAGTETS